VGKRSRNAFRILLCVVAALVLCVAAFFTVGPYSPVGLLLGKGWLVRNTPGRYAATQTRANELIDALERHRAAKGEYPVSLEELSPAYIERIEAPLLGDRKWRYMRPSPNQFVLNFFIGPIYYDDTWDSVKGEWYRDR
jgi:hypothetical protein